MYGVARRPQRRLGLAGFGAIEGGWEPLTFWKNRVTYVTGNITKAIAASTPTAAVAYFQQAQANVNDAANLIQAEVDAGQWTRFREAKISAKFAEARRLYGLGVALASTLGRSVGAMITWKEPTVGPVVAPSATPDIVSVAKAPPAVVTTPTGVSAMPAPGGGVEIVGREVRGVIDRYGVTETLQQNLYGRPLWQWVAIGGVGVVGLGLAAKLARLALFGGVIAGGAWATTQLPAWLAERERRARLGPS